jgi:hypothetical protein
VAVAKVQHSRASHVAATETVAKEMPKAGVSKDAPAAPAASAASTKDAPATSAPAMTMTAKPAVPGQTPTVAPKVN